jgi:hypothetical protein
MPPDRDRSFRRGFGFGLGFSLGSALVRLILAVVGVGLIVMFLNALLGKL